MLSKPRRISSVTDAHQRTSLFAQVVAGISVDGFRCALLAAAGIDFQRVKFSMPSFRATWTSPSARRSSRRHVPDGAGTRGVGNHRMETIAAVEIAAGIAAARKI